MAIPFLLSGNYCRVWLIWSLILGKFIILRTAANVKLKTVEGGKESISDSKMSLIKKILQVSGDLNRSFPDSLKARLLRSLS